MLLSPPSQQLNADDLSHLQSNLINLPRQPSVPQTDQVRDTMSRLSASLPGEEITEHYAQAKRSSNCFGMVFLMAFSLMPSFILLGGFKYVVYIAVRESYVGDEETVDGDEQ